jgi:hypothetical protein
MDTHRKRARKFGIADTRFGGSVTAFQPIKFQQKIAFFSGKWQADAAWDII